MNWGILKIAAIVLFICVLHMSHCADVLNQAKPTNGPNVVSENDIDNANTNQDSGKKPILPPTTSTTSAVKLTTSSVKQISQKPKEASGTNSSCNGTSCGKQLSGLESFMQKVKESKGMLLRTLYVLMGVTSIVIIYFVVRAWRLRRRSKTKRYGLITSRGTDMEMEPLDADDDDDDDDDMTVFELNKRRKK